jgi:hypothetical protein
MGANRQGMDYFLWATVAVTQVLVGFLGVLAIKSDFAGQHFKAFVAAFVILSVAGLIASGWGVVRATNASNEIARLQKDTLYAIAGSPDSHLQVIANFDSTVGGDYEKGIAVFLVNNDSEYPMMDTDVWVGRRRYLDIDDYSKVVGDMYPGRTRRLPGLQVQLNKDRICEIDFGIRSRSVMLWETIKFVWDGNGWVYDWCI